MSVDALPEGTVTVLSTDLVGSTALNQRLGDEAATLVEREVEALALEQVEKQRATVEDQHETIKRWRAELERLRNGHANHDEAHTPGI